MLQDRLLHLLEPAIVALGYELVLLEYHPGLRTATLRLFIDSENGVNVDDCETVSREVAALLDVEDPITKAYQLEVSSPGVDRPLTKPQHFLKVLGEEIKVTLVAPLLKRNNYSGILLAFAEETLSLKVGEETFTFTLSQIERARLVPNYTQLMRNQKSKAEILL